MGGAVKCCPRGLTGTHKLTAHVAICTQPAEDKLKLNQLKFHHPPQKKMKGEELHASIKKKM